MRNIGSCLPRAAGSLWLAAAAFAGSDPQAPPQPPKPMTGLIWMCGPLSEGQTLIQNVEKTLGANPSLSGVFVNCRWADLEPEQGQFSWETLDALTETIRRHGRFYKLLMTPGAYTPEWVYKLGAQAFETLGPNPYREATYNKPLRIPVPWDEVFLREFERLARALGQRYGADPLCAAVGVTGANFQSAEMHLPKLPADREKWEALDYRPNLRQAYRRYIDLFAEAFPRQRLCLHVSTAISADDGIVEDAAAYGAERYPDRFTLQNCQLSGKSDTRDQFSYALIQKYAGRLHVGYQSLALLGSARQGDSQVSVFNFVRGQGEYWELWRGNGQDPQLCAWLLDEIARAKAMGPEAYRAELEAKGLLRSQ